MNPLREAAQQALEALEAMNPYPASKEDQRASALAALLAALAQQAEPVQEPVGEILPNWSTEKECIDGIWAYLNVLGKNLPVGTKLYTAPPQRTMVPLTEEEIDAEWRELDGEVSTMFMRVLRKFARAVEKTSWKKNHGQA